MGWLKKSVTAVVPLPDPVVLVLMIWGGTPCTFAVNVWDPTRFGLAASVASTVTEADPPTVRGGLTVITPVLGSIAIHDGALLRLKRTGSPIGSLTGTPIVSAWPLERLAGWIGPIWGGMDGLV